MRARGQTMVLAALSILLLALMVLVTLSIAWRVRDRIETQVAADAAAYSEAVEVARTFNQLALMNRAQIAMEVAGLGMSSLMAWSSHHYANMVGLKNALQDLEGIYASECNPFNPCPCEQIPLVQISIGAAEQELARLKGLWDNEEKAAAQQLRTDWNGAALLYNASQDMLNKTLIGQRLKNQRLANTIATCASIGCEEKSTDQHPLELVAPSAGDKKSIAEVKGALYTGDDMTALQQPGQVTMGTRGYHFVTMGQGGFDPIKQKLDEIARAGNGAATAEPAFEEGQAGTGLGTDRHDQTVKKVMAGKRVWAEDHGGTVSITWPCGCTETGSAGVKDTKLSSGGQGNGNNVHSFDPGDNEPASTRHAISPDATQTFPAMQVYNFPEIENPKNDFGQPKLYAVIDRDYRKVKEKPWDLRFTFHFTKQGGEFDDNGTKSSFKSLSGADLQHQVGVGSAIAYYHRPDGWAEPPNFFNPFWRATLYAADDDVGKDLQKAGFSEQGTAVQQLIKQGLGVVTR